MPLIQVTPASKDALDAILYGGGSSTGQALVFDGTEWANQFVDLSGLRDVSFGAPPTKRQMLAHDGARWTNEDAALSRLSDVSLTSVAPGDALVFDGSAWTSRPTAVYFSSLADIASLAPSERQVLEYDRSRWTNDWAYFTRLADVSVVSPVSGQQIRYDAAAKLWANATPTDSVTDFSNLGDISGLAPSERQVLGYHNSAWVNVSPCLSALADTSVAAPLPGQVLAWDSSAQRWANADAGPTAFSALVDISGLRPADGDVLGYSGGWTNLPQALAALADTSLPAEPADGDVLTFAASRWRAAAPAAPATYFSALADISCLSPSPGQVLGYRTTAWTNVSQLLSGLADTSVVAPVVGGQLLVFVASHWTNGADPTCFSALADIAPLSPTADQVLAWDGARWANASPALSLLGDASVAAPAGGQVLTFDAPTGRWTNRAGVDCFSALSDIAALAPAANQVLAFDGTAWTSATQLLSRLADTSVIGTPGTGQLLAFDGTHWTNRAAAGTPWFSALSDISSLSPAANQVLAYDGARWLNAAQLLSRLADASVVAPTSNQVLAFDGTRWRNATRISNDATMGGGAPSTVVAPSQAAVATYIATMIVPLVNPGTVGVSGNSLVNSTATPIIDVGALMTASLGVCGIGFGTALSPIVPTTGTRLVVRWAPAAKTNWVLTLTTGFSLSGTFPPIAGVSAPAYPIGVVNGGSVSFRSFACVVFVFAAGFGSTGAWLMQM